MGVIWMSGADQATVLKVKQTRVKIEENLENKELTLGFIWQRLSPPCYIPLSY